ncbi:MAG: hypothetical protein M3Q54_01460 [Actinomycetota bacterium]|jgi:CTP synthase (UTP-ammonia lyase)|nr:hypothetical protein [Rubrobacter sp.]MDQ3236189.1 hypothetical protein [Actinomycetota bacterium]
MAEIVRVGIIGDHNPGKLSHKATDVALEHAAGYLSAGVEAEWLPTSSLEERAVAVVERFDALWCAPGSPYESFDGALAAIRLAREGGVPFIGTCGGFQHVVIEYARNALGFTDARHAEYEPDSAEPFVSALSCSLVGENARVTLRLDTEIHAIYGGLEVEEEFLCSFGLDPRRRELLESGGMCVSGEDETGEARIVELPDHPFYIATLFVPQMRSSPENPHPLVVAFLRAALDARERREAREEVA